MSYDVKALFTSVPIHPAIDVIKKLLEEDGELQQRTKHVSQPYYQPPGVLLEKYIFHLPRQAI